MENINVISENHENEEVKTLLEIEEKQRLKLEKKRTACRIYAKKQRDKLKAETGTTYSNSQYNYQKNYRINNWEQYLESQRPHSKKYMRKKRAEIKSAKTEQTEQTALNE